MLSELLELKEGESLDDLCGRFGRFLGLEAPVPKPVLLHAINDSDYATHLIVSRGAPEFLQVLFGMALPAEGLQEASSATDAAAGQSDLELVKRAATALLRWGKSGFSIVDEATLERREDACLACPNLGTPGSLLQKLVSSGSASGKLGQRASNRVCKLCGCNIAKKIRLASESCPDRHPTQAGLTRWGEPQPQSA